MTLTHEVRATTTATPVLVTAHEPYPGLRIYQQPEELRRTTDGPYTWRLGHHSGLAIAAFEYPGDADDAAWALHNLTDWTQDADHIRNTIPTEAVEAAFERSPGILLTRSPKESQ